MRNAINISLPTTMTKVVRQAVKQGSYVSTSEFFRDLLRNWIEEERLSQAIKTSEQEFAASQGKKLRSLADLR